MDLLLISLMLIGHWVGDFLLQKNKTKPTKEKKIKNKIKKLVKYLVPHTLIYTSILTFFIGVLHLLGHFGEKPLVFIILFFVITYITHFLVDFFVTLINSDYLGKNKRHSYFISIGVDQAMHYFIIALTIKLLYF